MKPNPSFESGIIYSAFLSKPAARPTLFGNVRPITVVGLDGILFFSRPQKQANFKPFIEI
jgi:hypothetical protein